MWSQWPWLHTMASIEDGSMPRRRMFSVTPSGLVPASNRNRCSCPALVTVTRTENPCSAISASGACPASISADGRGGPLPKAGRLAGPISVIRLSVTLSISVVTTTESTGSRSISMAGSTSWRKSRALRPAGLSSMHTGPW